MSAPTVPLGLSADRTAEILDAVSEYGAACHEAAAALWLEPDRLGARQAERQAAYERVLDLVREDLHAAVGIEP